MMFFFFKQKTAYEMRISDWSSDVCSSDLLQDSPSRIPATYRWMRTRRGGRWSTTTISGGRRITAGGVANPRCRSNPSPVAASANAPRMAKIGRAQVCTPVTNAKLVCRLLLENKKNKNIVETYRSTDNSQANP